MAGFLNKLIKLEHVFGKNRDSGAAAMPYLNQVPGVGKQYYDPFISQGQEASNALNPQYAQMAQNPMDYLANLLGGYNGSPQFQFQRDQALRAMQNSSAAGGFAGTPYDQQTQGQYANDLANQDIQSYLENVLGIQGAGMQGQEGAVTRGYGASGNLANLLSSNLQDQASLAYQNSERKNANSWKKKMMVLQGLSQAMGGGGMGSMGGLQGGGPPMNTINWNGG